MSRKIIRAALLILLLAFSVSVNAIAQEPDPTLKPTPSDNDVNRIAKNMYCPVCENTPLDVCETQACADWREEIRLRLSEGWSDQEIYDYFVERHGDRVLATPPRRGLNWLVYIVPPVVFVAGALLLFRVLRTSLGKSEPESDGERSKPASRDEDEYAARLEDELNKRQ
jgi:cytochrome c-type biogenesis protein CcmH